MPSSTTPLDNLAPDRCVCECPYGCQCPPGEKALRFILGHRPGTYFTQEQREWCLDEIGSVEGYRREDYADLSDPEIARGVLDAWLDYCRDKGLL